MAERVPEIERALENPDNNYVKWRQLDDGTYVAMIKLMFTMAIVTDVDVCGYHNRFCFDDVDLAYREFDRLENRDSEPVGWIARR
ncbi:Uncharacterised protein [Ectopseudomonas mendocina]|uniref:Uncharacterized protein n=1 Tax=Ectopseudomonas mendocina TaxID=300 RepID=A0A379PLQ9_ECTME|nr:hypothetical protein [Pseudomonas mendocina]SUE95890.1 Uncharacterised protein [Pseudomonas mendocina]